MLAKSIPMLRLFSLCLLGAATQATATKLAEVGVIDESHLLLRFLDGEVAHRDDGLGATAFTHDHEDTRDTVKTYGTALNTTQATTAMGYKLKSTDHAAFASAGLSPTNAYRRSKLNGTAEKGWNTGTNDYNYEYTMEHQVFLKLPQAMQQGKTYTIEIPATTNSDKTTHTFTYDIYTNRSEAIKVNLAGYAPSQPKKAADLYMWLGDGGARNYTSHVGKKVYLVNASTNTPTEVGTVAFWKASASEAQNYNLIRSDVWRADFDAFSEPGTYRLAIEGVGCSQDFSIQPYVYRDPFQVSVKGFYYMRIGEDSISGLKPVPRRPLYIPGVSPANTKVILTTMQPYHANWDAFKNNSDPWDKKDEWATYKKAGDPTNPNAKGGHSDALDWDRHLGHVSIIYDMLLPIILLQGNLPDDNLGIRESGNGVPDIIDEARNEVDFWLNLRDGAAYAHGLNNPNNKQDNIFYQAGPTVVAAWANAANAAMLAEAYRLAGQTALSNQYRDSASVAYNYGDSQADKQLDLFQDVGEARFRGRDFRMLAAAMLYNLTGESKYEQVINEESVCASSSTAALEGSTTFNQVYASAAYMFTNRTVNYTTLQQNMKACAIHQAKVKHVDYSKARPSRRSSDNGMGYFQTIQNVHHALLAHAVATSQIDKDDLHSALVLEADWGLGRNPMNMIQMTTGTTTLGAKRSVQGAYTSGADDGSPGMHPGHTPYMNTNDWDASMVMGRPSWLTGKSYPAWSNWPVAESYHNARHLWAHNEFTPQQTMRGKMALYGYLYGLAVKQEGGTSLVKGLSLPQQGFTSGAWHMELLDVNGRVVWNGTVNLFENAGSSTVHMALESAMGSQSQTLKGVYLVKARSLSQRSKTATLRLAMH